MKNNLTQNNILNIPPQTQCVNLSLGKRKMINEFAKRAACAERVAEVTP
jgi:hypothetical protein